MLRFANMILFLAAAAISQPVTYVARYDGVAAFPVPKTTAAGIAVTSVSTITGPRSLIYASQAYDCNTTGLYRFWAPLGSGANRIVWAGDIAKLMSAFAWIHSWGAEDNGLSIGACTTRAGTAQLRSQCGLVCLWAKAVCDSLDAVGGPPVQTRLARVLTAEASNGWYDGHIMLEAKHPDGWRLYDIANGLTYGATPLALKDAVPLALATPRVPICRKSFSVTPVGSFDVAAWNLLRMTNKGDAATDLVHVFQIPGIDDAGLTWFYLPPGTEHRASWVLGLSPLFRVLTKADWLAKFYP